MADATHEYHHGDQPIAEQVATYRSFGELTKWGSLTIATMVLMLTLWFCLGSGFFGGLIPGVVVFALGGFFLRSNPDQSH
jgi:thiamine transporter ThiT